jgi:hypothetical protein
MNSHSVSLKTEEDLESDEAMRLSAELSLLSGQQYEALQRASYHRMSDPERDAYDRRRVRIGELCSFLGKLQTKTMNSQVSAESISPRTPRQVALLGEQ